MLPRAKLPFKTLLSKVLSSQRRDLRSNSSRQMSNEFALSVLFNGPNDILYSLRPPRICVNRELDTYRRRLKKENSICPHNCPTTYVSHYQGRSFIFPLRHLPFMDSLFLSSPMTSSRTIFNGKRERHCWRLISCPQLPGLFIILWLLFLRK